MKAIVLAAGKGSRLGQYTDITPKPFLPLGGKKIIHYVLDNLSTAAQLKEVHVALSPRDYEHVSQRVNLNGYPMKVEMMPALGWETGGDLKSTAYMAGVNGTFIVCFGDNVTHIDVGALLDFHKKMGRLATVALFNVTDAERSRMGIARVSDGVVTEWKEKPAAHEVVGSNLANAGYYVFEPSVLDAIPYGKHKTEVSVLPKLVEQGQLAGFLFKTPYWFDIGTPESYEQATRMILEQKGVIAPTSKANGGAAA
ncbi:MAG: NDP-sugar synthase [Candidatus Aenigmarchaeota archaeon]|nr:NDP-sugar synthase [Candidatus Aenigmarchaeota archaeon]